MKSYKKEITLKRIVIDLDNTIAYKGNYSYAQAKPDLEVIAKLQEYSASGFEIVIHTSRNMRTHDGSVGKINVQTLPVILSWLESHGVPHDEVIVGKPWCGIEGFYVDDKSIRPDEFKNLTYERIKEIVSA